MFSIINAKTQSSTKRNLQSLISEHEAKIQQLSTKKDSLRNELMQLKFSSNRASGGNGVQFIEISGDNNDRAPIQSFVKKELHQLTKLELALGHSRLKIEQTKRELKRTNALVTEIDAGLEHIIRMCGSTKKRMQKLNARPVRLIRS